MIEFENFIDETLQNTIEDFTKSKKFPWYYDNIIDEKLFEVVPDVSQYVYRHGSNPHQLIHAVILESKINSDLYWLIEPLVKNLSIILKKDIEIKRAKFNMLHKSNEKSYHYPHSDARIEDGEGTKTLLYYVNDSDGDTFIFNKSAPVTDYTDFDIEKRVTPKKGKGLLFDANILHSSSCPINNDYRIVLNIIFKTLD